MPRSPKLRRRDNDIYWSPASFTGGANITSANDSPGATAAARYRFIFLKGGGKAKDSDELIKGLELGKQIKPFVSSVDIEEDEEMTTKLTLTMQNVDFLLSQKQIITEGDACIVEIGYGERFFGPNRRYVFIRSHPAFTRDGVPSIKYVAYDGRFAMISADFMVNKRSRQLAGGNLIKGRRQGLGQSPSVFKNMTDEEVIDKIAYHYGFSIDIDPIPGKKTRVKKKKTSDWEFIRKIAKKRNYTSWVDWDFANQTYCIHYRKKETRFSQGYVFHYGTPTPKEIKAIEMAPGASEGPIGTLLEFNPTLDTSRMITDIEVIHFDRHERYLDSEWLSYNDKSLPPPDPDPDAYDLGEIKAYGALLKFKVGGRVIQTLTAKPFKNKKQAKEYAFNLVNEYQADFMTGRGVVIGVQDLRPRQVHRLTGIGRYSGDYYFTQATQHLRPDGFYECPFVAYRLLDQTLPGLIRRGQITQRWAAPLITANGIRYPGS